MPTISDVVLVNGAPVNGASVSAYKASRFAGVPAFNAAPPAGGPDAGPVTSGLGFGGAGNFELTVPTSEDYYCGATTGGQTAWQRYSLVTGFSNPLTTLGDLFAGGSSGVPTRLGLGSAGQFVGNVGGVLGYGIPAPQPVTITTQSGSTYTLALTDANTEVEATSGSAVTVTIPTNASVAFPVGTIINIRQMGAGQVTVAAAGGVTLDLPLGAKTRAQYSTVSLVKRATNEWVLGGDSST